MLWLGAVLWKLLLFREIIYAPGAPAEDLMRGGIEREQMNHTCSSVSTISCRQNKADLYVNHRGEPNRGYKEPNPNPNILSLVFVSYNRIRIVQKGIRFLINRIPIFDFCIRFKRNRTHDFNQIIRLIRISGFFNRILAELFGWSE